MKTRSRRQFLKSAAVSTAGVLAMRSIPAWAQTTPKKGPIVPPLSVFGYANVQLLDGPFRLQFEQNHELFLHLNEDGLLKPFRQRQGMPAPGPDLGGWYDNADDFNEENNFHGFIAGHTFGQYLSGLARAYAVTSSKPTQEKVHRLVRAFAETVEPTGKFYVDYRLPGYTFDKTCCGLIDAHEFAADPIALDVLRQSTDAVLRHLPEKALGRAEQEARPLHVCPDCDSPLVQPLSWAETEDEQWELELSCPNCEWREDGVYGQTEIEDLEDRLEDGLADLLDDLHRLAQANMADENGRFVRALEADLILPEDF